MPSPFYTTTARRALRALLGTSNISDVDAGFLALATDVENTMAGYSSGTHAARGSATAYDGLLWRETDTGVWALYNGSAWVTFGPLAVTSMTVNGPAAPGQMIFASPGVTVTLPAATAGAVLRVVTSNAVTGASPVLVQSGSANIFGGGVSSGGVSSFLIGTGAASVDLAAAAGNWQIVAGRQDSGVVAFTYSGGAAASGGSSPGSRLIGDRVWLYGQVTGGAGQQFTITSAHHPARQLTFAVGQPAGGSTTLIVPASGVVTNGLPMALDGVNYPLI